MQAYSTVPAARQHQRSSVQCSCRNGPGVKALLISTRLEERLGKRHFRDPWPAAMALPLRSKLATSSGHQQQSYVGYALCMPA